MRRQPMRLELRSLHRWPQVEMEHWRHLADVNAAALPRGRADLGCFGGWG